jgi:hypothetical protein
MSAQRFASERQSDVIVCHVANRRLAAPSAILRQLPNAASLQFDRVPHVTNSVTADLSLKTPVVQNLTHMTLASDASWEAAWRAFHGQSSGSP